MHPNVLIVDDSHARHATILTMLGKVAPLKGWTIVSRYSPAGVSDAELVQADIVFLDHDMCLGSHPIDEPSPLPLANFCPTSGESERCTCPTGLDLAERLCDLLSPEPGHRAARPAVVVHSANVIGRGRMTDLLRGRFREVYTVPGAVAGHGSWAAFRERAERASDAREDGA